MCGLSYNDGWRANKAFLLCQAEWLPDMIGRLIVFEDFKMRREKSIDMEILQM